MIPLRFFGPSVCLLLLIGTAGCRNHPSDRHIQALFQTNYASFTNIVHALKAYPDVKRVDWSGGTLVIDNADPAPPNLAERLLPSLAPFGKDLLVVSAGKGAQIWFYVSTSGSYVSGSAKGVVYQEVTPDRLVEDTDASSRTNYPFTVFHQLKSNWYVFFSR